MALIALSGCGNGPLDFRNAEVSNGKIYSDGANEPFSGKVTNIPMGKLPLGQLRPLVATLTNVTGEKAYSDFFISNAIAAVVSGDGGPVLCDVQAREGLLDGGVQCGIQGSKVLEVSFSTGAMEGKARIFDLKGKGAVAAKAGVKAGTLNGDSTVYDTETGKVLHTVGWQNGLPSGPEKLWNRSGTLIWEGTFVGGKYEGKGVRYNQQGEVALTSFFKAGVVERNIRPGMSDLENCVQDWEAALQNQWGGSAPVGETHRQQWREACEQGRRWNSPSPVGQPPQTAQNAPTCVSAWISAFRKELGEDAPVNHDQLGEWQEWCKQGKRPG